MSANTAGSEPKPETTRGVPGKNLPRCAAGRLRRQCVPGRPCGDPRVVQEMRRQCPGAGGACNRCPPARHRHGHDGACTHVGTSPPIQRTYVQGPSITVGTCRSDCSKTVFTRCSMRISPTSNNAKPSETCQAPRASVSEVHVQPSPTRGRSKIPLPVVQFAYRLKLQNTGYPGASRRPVPKWQDLRLSGVRLTGHVKAPDPLRRSDPV